MDQIKDFLDNTDPEQWEQMMEDDSFEPEELTPEMVAATEDVQKIARSYGKAVSVFFKENEAYFEEFGDSTAQRAAMGIPIDYENIQMMRNAVDTIQWYQFFIGVKVTRAFGSVEYRQDIQSDANGSAKIGMIAVQRSLDAWVVFDQNFNDKKLKINKLTKKLQQLKDYLSQFFPDWKQFHRPGFDDAPHQVIRLDINPN
jgi:hypothetical protein